MKIDIDNPCNENWEQMTGCEQKRFCGSCNKNVYNISEMTETEASTLLKTIKDPCVRFSEDENSNIQFRPSKAPTWFLLAAALTAGCKETEIQAANEIQIVERAQPLTMPGPEMTGKEEGPATSQQTETTSKQNNRTVSTETAQTNQPLPEKKPETSKPKRKRPKPPTRKKMGLPKVKIKR